MFPRALDNDPFEVMHQNDSLVLGYQYLTVTSATSSKNFWENTLLFMAYRDVDVVGAARDKTRFLKRFLMQPQGWNEAPTWNSKVVMTDCELLRVSFFVPGTRYYEYFQYLDALGGFWLYRWGDHAMRALGTALALWPHEEEAALTNASRLSAYDMKLP